MRVKRKIFLLMLVFVFFASFASAQQQRLWDDDVKELLEESVKTSDKFRDAFKKVSSITTKAGAQVDVQQYMSDYKETFGRFKDAFDEKHTPSSDFANLLRMTNEIDAVMTRNPDAAGAGSEWQAHKFNVERLAQAFGTGLGEGAPPARRMSDDQVKSLFEELKQGSKLLGKNVKDAMKKDATFDEATRKSHEESLKALEKKAELVGKLFNDKKPMSVEMQDFLKQMDTVKGFLTEHPLTSAVQSDWGRLEKKAGQLRNEYFIES